MRARILSTVLAVTLGSGLASAQGVREAPVQRTRTEVAPAARRPCPATLPRYANSTTNCSSGLLSFTCSAGFADINGLPADGCEARLDGFPATFASALPLGVMQCGASRTMSGNTAPLGSDDWFQLTLTAACPSVLLTLSGSGVVYYDVIESGSFPPATSANARLSGTHSFTSPAPRQLSIRVWAPTLVTYALTAAAH